MKLLLVGATGLVGSHVLCLALSDDRISAVVAPSRRELASHPKLQTPIVDFDRLPEDAPWWQADALVCTLGTTMAKAGSKEAFQRVDHDYPLQAGRLARQHGTPTYVLNSALGADASSRIFYNRVKGALEQDLAQLQFTSLTFVRPGLIGGEREEVRTAERLSIAALSAIGPLLPRRWRLNPAPRIAQALLEAAVNPQPGVHVVPSEQMC